MGALVRRDEWYISYPEFCRIFINIDHSRRDDHVFMRALDFFGGNPLLTVEAAMLIIRALDSLLDFLSGERRTREAAEQARLVASA
jgi:hypothetical protein